MDSFASLVRLYDAFLMEVRVAELQICRDSACSFSANPELPKIHLLVNLVDVPLHRDYATAISYAWGEFDRQKRTVGHTFQPTEHVQLELGTEWVVSDVIDRLAELSEEKLIWMDQICIPQEEDNVLKTLAGIPSVFSTLDVVALFPGSLCGCIPKLVEEISRLPSHDHGWKDTEQVMECTLRVYPCLSSGASSWNKRMWTYQELMYSQRFRCVWASKVKNLCVRLHDPDINTENLPPFQRRMFQMLTKCGSPQKSALACVEDYLQTTQLSLWEDLYSYCKSRGTSYRLEQFYHFLLGEQLNLQQNSSIARFKFGSTVYFLWRLFAVPSGRHSGARARREATNPQDYIISVWTGCPDYILPHDYKSMSVAELMQDALDQLRRNHQTTLVVTTPRGLFDASSFGSAIWSPSEYLSEIDLSCDVDLYRVLADEGMAVRVPRGLGNSVPIVLRDMTQPSLSTCAMDYEMLVNHFHEALSHEIEASGNLANSTVAQTVIKLLHRTMFHWTDDRAEAVQVVLDRLVQEWHTRPINRQSWCTSSATVQWLHRFYPIKNCIQFLCSHRKTKAFDEAYYQELDSLINLRKLEHIHKIVYDVVATVLELDPEYCEKKNVKLIFSSIDNNKQRPPRVGLCRGDMDIEEIASGRRKTITISIGDTNTGLSNLLYEAFYVKDVETRLEEEGFGNIRIAPAYQVFAVWIPIDSVFDAEYGAYTRWIRRYLPEENVGVLL